MSELTDLRALIELQGQSAQLGFSGFAAVASHQAVNTMMRERGQMLVDLFEQGKTEQAFALWEDGFWDPPC
jgi:hypothetical protein